MKLFTFALRERDGRSKRLQVSAKPLVGPTLRILDHGQTFIFRSWRGKTQQQHNQSILFSRNQYMMESENSHTYSR